MRILYVDYFQKDGHVNFNRIHIDALRRAGHDVKLVFHSEIAQQLPYPASDYALRLPRILRFREGRPLLNRLVFLITLLYIRAFVRVGRYDKVVLGCIDEISYSLLPLCRDAYIHAHGNGRFLPAADGSLAAGTTKYHAMKRLAPRATFIVYNDYMAEPFIRAHFPNVRVVSHGCVPPFQATNADANILTQLPVRITPEQKIIFHPSGKCNEDFVRHSLTDARLHRALADHNAYIILRNRPKWINIEQVPGRIIFIDGFLSNDLYRALFLRADAILMCYPPTFHHQVSGVSFECVANAKPILALSTPPLTYLRNWCNYDPLFTSPPELAERILLLFDDSSAASLIITPDQLIPDYKDVF